MMVERVVLQPRVEGSRVVIRPLGSAAIGFWGLIEQAEWLQLPATMGLELLYGSRAEYEHATRGLIFDDKVDALVKRRAMFSLRLPELAISEVEVRGRAVIAATPSERAELRADWVTALASFTVVRRFARSSALDLLDALRDGEGRLLAELESTSLNAVESPDPTGNERRVRQRFGFELGGLAARYGYPEKAEGIPYFDVERAYFVEPVTPELEEHAHAFHDPSLHFHAGLVLPLPEREVGDIEARGHRAQIAFVSRGAFAGALEALTPAQLEVELGERLGRPDFAEYLVRLRIQQATLREGVRLLAGVDAELAPVLASECAEEARELGTWLRHAGREQSVEAVERALDRALADAELFAALCRQKQREPLALRLEALARALSHAGGRGEP
jgi:hypothetical protein